MVLVTPESRAVRRRRERMCSDGAILRIQDCSITFNDASIDADCNHSNGRERHHVQISKRAIWCWRYCSAKQHPRGDGICKCTAAEILSRSIRVAATYWCRGWINEGPKDIFEAVSSFSNKEERAKEWHNICTDTNSRCNPQKLNRCVAL